MKGGRGKSREERGAIMTGERQGEMILLPVAFLTFRDETFFCNKHTREITCVLRVNREEVKHEMHAE